MKAPPITCGGTPKSRGRPESFSHRIVDQGTPTPMKPTSTLIFHWEW